MVKQYYKMALDDSGCVWVWGYNGYGEIGDGRTQNKPALIEFIKIF